MNGERLRAVSMMYRCNSLFEDFNLLACIQLNDDGVLRDAYDGSVKIIGCCYGDADFKILSDQPFVLPLFSLRADDEQVAGGKDCQERDKEAGALYQQADIVEDEALKLMG